jgi:hypothetical protein
VNITEIPLPLEAVHAVGSIAPHQKAFQVLQVSNSCRYSMVFQINPSAARRERSFLRLTGNPVTEPFVDRF